MANDIKTCCGCGHAPSAPKENHISAQENASVENMISVKGGNFLMGTNDEDGFPQDGEGPVREVTVDSFFIDATTVTNQQFAEFISATGYTTDAERFGWSFVFYALLSEKMKDTHPQVSAQTPWWCAIRGAKWNRPEGFDSDIQSRMDHPVVHVSWNDAQAYCKWSGKRLPTEAEWEYAARGGLIQNKFPWGNELTPDGEHRCNIWQGKFPGYNSLEDGYLGTAPAKSFKPNGFGLYNMAGNVWEWCSDWFSPDFHKTASVINPKGPLNGTAKVIRGGSFLCHESYCNRYRVAARTSNTIDSSTSNMGFRCVV
ncbi:MAG: formylglycine-generating enzyme family protein [Ginsengibacter sp.]